MITVRYVYFLQVTGMFFFKAPFGSRKFQGSKVRISLWGISVFQAIAAPPVTSS